MKTEFLIFSDLHAHNFTYGAKKVEIEGFSGLFNSRLADTIKVLDEIEEYAASHDITDVLFGGDLFHTRASVPTDVRSLVVRRLQRFKRKDITLHMLVGNHDMGDKWGYVHSLDGLNSEEIQVFGDVGCSWIRQVQVVGVPYTPSIDTAKEWLSDAAEVATAWDGPSILLAHLGMQGARVGSDYVMMSESDIRVEDINKQAFTACFFGHFHEHQQLFENGWFIGASHEHNWGDAGGKRGFLHVTVEGDSKDASVSFKRVETDAPKHIVSKEGAEAGARPQDFLRVVGSPAFVQAHQQENPDAHVEYIPVEPNKAEDFHLDVDKLNIDDMVESWVSVRGGEFNYNDLVQTAKELLSGE